MMSCRPKRACTPSRIAGASSANVMAKTVVPVHRGMTAFSRSAAASSASASAAALIVSDAICLPSLRTPARELRAHGHGRADRRRARHNHLHGRLRRRRAISG